MNPWFLTEGDVIPFTKKDDKVVKLPSIDHYTSFIDGVMDLQSQLEQGNITKTIYDKLYQDIIRKFSKKESAETPWFMNEAPATNTVLFADPQEVDQMASFLLSKGVKFNKSKTKMKSGVKTLRANLSTVDDVQKALGNTAKVVPVEQGIDPTISGKKQLTKSKFDFKGKIYFIITQGEMELDVDGKKSKTTLAAVKGLTPTDLGLQSTYPNPKALALDVLQKIKQQYTHPVVVGLLTKLVHNAQNPQSPQTLTPPESQYLNEKSNFKGINKNFGEVLSALTSQSGEGKIEFPAGNEPIIDVKIGNMSIAVKALKGSGNAFTKVAELFDTFAQTINPKDQAKKAKFKMMKIFSMKKSKDFDSVNAQILYAAYKIMTPEMVELLRITKTDKISNVAELTTALQPLVEPKGKPISYEKFLELQKIVGSASGKLYGRPRGGSETGENNFKGLKSAVKTMIYTIGKGMDNFVNNGVDKEVYGEIVNGIMRQVKAYVGIVKVTPEGTVSLSVKPFSELNFKFDYHAYTSNPGNNRPGFAIVL
jgi:hypothetical protein